ncbi:hypothetical protein GGS23DRAFT_511142 [Durotheca rogersii]|uniref:uncharacterized protein n=1 Tax=Durotheca rogersii TaxID=419775 RepID=UPI0022211D9E|nr:uncharacterized protein GGS23DRAFT_511142 [Durotheca rogersii]KAI5863710.1 hypothetical protein GGS23DRAFT_511142 [Durotheca rogersii]
MSSTPKGFQCTFPGCDKAFNRKEHLNRHTKSHDPQLQYKCLLCGRRYARSDVLRRHVKHHHQAPQQAPNNNNNITCTPCRDRNSECDGNSPCRSCIQNSVDCDWTDRESRDAGVNVVNENGFGMPDEIGAAVTDRTSVLLPPDHGQAAWFSPDQDAWGSRPCPEPTSFHPGYRLQGTTDPMSYVPPSLSSITIDDSSSTSLSVNIGRVENLSYGSSNSASRHSRTISPPTSQHHSLYSSPEAGTMPDKHAIVDRGSLTTKRLIKVFFNEIHPYWPILHAPTFVWENAPTVLLASMIMLASWLEGGPEHQRIAPLVLEEVARIQINLSPPLHLLQATLFSIVYTLCSLTVEGMVPRALSLTSLLVAACRYLGIFNGQYTDPEVEDEILDCPFVSWRAQEQLNRLAFSILRVDAYLSVLLDHPPSVRYQELWIPLPKSHRLWAAASDEDRRRLQWDEPAGREKALFSFLIRDLLDPSRNEQLPYSLTDIDYHLGTCATQPDLWVAAREAHSSMSDELVDETDPSISVWLAQPQISLWRGKQRQACEVRSAYFSGTLPSIGDGGGIGGQHHRHQHLLAPLTFTLMHVSTLKLHAPLNTLSVRGYYYKSRPGAAIPTRKPRAHLRGWITSGCPRTALWNAAQVCRIYTIESGDPSAPASGSGGASSPSRRARLLLNPLLIPGILMSAVVTCSFAFYTPSCDDCAPQGPSPGLETHTVDLFNTNDEDDPVLQRWRDHGLGVPTWGAASGGGGGIPVCKCRLSELAAWFREAFARDKGAEVELVLFLAELSRESKDAGR